MKGRTVKNTDFWSWVKIKAEKIKAEAYGTHPDGEMYSFPKYQLIRDVGSQPSTPHGTMFTVYPDTGNDFKFSIKSPSQN